MELEERVADVERRLAALESAAPRTDSPQGDRKAGLPAEHDDAFWALRGWKEQLAGERLERGGVLFTGSVGTPDGRTYEWQSGATTDDLMESDWSPAVDSLAALGHTVRLRLLRELHEQPRTVAELAALEDLGTTGQIYHHLRQLTSTGWLRTVSRGRYEVPPERVVPLLVVLAAVRR